MYSPPNGYSRETIAGAFDPRQLQLILLPTEKCNFRCTYCYESFAIGRMAANVVVGVKNLIERRAKSIDLLDISWFGGEPLLELPIILDILQHANGVAVANGFEFRSGFTTNGYNLTVPLVGQLAELNAAKFQVTLDGEKDIHDQSRILANGKGTFDVIWNNLVALRETSLNFHITLRLHISARSQKSIVQFVQGVTRTFGDDSRFSIHFHRVTDLGGPNKSEDSFLTETEYRSVLQKAINATTIRASSEVHLDEAREICYAAKPNSLLVRANGRLGKCTVALEDPRNDIGCIKLDGTLEIDNSKVHLWMEGFSDMNPPSLSCPLSTLGKSKRDIPVEVEVL